MPFPYEDFDLSGVRTYPLASRPSKVQVGDFATPYDRDHGVGGLLHSLPRLLAGADFRAVVDAVSTARRGGGGVVWGVGAHVIKNGLAPVLIDLAERGYVSAIATNGAAIIHDFEIAMGGHTSEDVDESLGEGRFGMAEETSAVLNHVIREGVAEGLGIGQAVGKFLAESHPPHAAVSLAAAAWRLEVPLTVHIAIGTDIIHMHEAASGAALGEGSLRDFRYFASAVARLERGVYLNCGSAVLLPEVFLKAVALARNRHRRLDGLTTVNIDFLRMYRAETNVVRRPIRGNGRGYSLIGAHELLIPLLAAALIEAEGRSTASGG